MATLKKIFNFDLFLKAYNFDMASLLVANGSVAFHNLHGLHCCANKFARLVLGGESICNDHKEHFLTIQLVFI